VNKIGVLNLVSINAIFCPKLELHIAEIKIKSSLNLIVVCFSIISIYTPKLILTMESQIIHHLKEKVARRNSHIAEIRLYYKPKKETRPKISCSADGYNQALKFFDKNTIALQEQFIVLYLNRANLVLGGHKVFTGGLTGTVADVRLILGIALKACACSIIISHNHPSGNLKPSGADQELTNKLKEAGKLMDITLLDHIILSPEGTFYSFADEGLI
jgi:DNA repair protein RadC